MVSIEIMLVIAFTLMAGVMYIICRYFDDQINNMINIHMKINKNFEEYIQSSVSGSYDLLEGKLNKRIDLIEQKTKDSIQSNSICCRSAMDRINSRLALLEKERHGSIKVVTKDKDNGTNKSTTKKPISS